MERLDTGPVLKLLLGDPAPPHDIDAYLTAADILTRINVPGDPRGIRLAAVYAAYRSAVCGKRYWAMTDSILSRVMEVDRAAVVLAAAAGAAWPACGVDARVARYRVLARYYAAAAVSLSCDAGKELGKQRASLLAAQSATAWAMLVERMQGYMDLGGFYTGLLSYTDPVASLAAEAVYSAGSGAEWPSVLDHRVYALLEALHRRDPRGAVEAAARGYRSLAEDVGGAPWAYRLLARSIVIAVFAGAPSPGRRSEAAREMLEVLEEQGVPGLDPVLYLAALRWLCDRCPVAGPRGEKLQDAVEAYGGLLLRRLDYVKTAARTAAGMGVGDALDAYLYMLDLAFPPMESPVVDAAEWLPGYIKSLERLEAESWHHELVSESERLTRVLGEALGPFNGRVQLLTEMNMLFDRGPDGVGAETHGPAALALAGLSGYELLAASYTSVYRFRARGVEAIIDALASAEPLGVRGIAELLTEPAVLYLGDTRWPVYFTDEEYHAARKRRLYIAPLDGAYIDGEPVASSNTGYWYLPPPYIAAMHDAYRRGAVQPLLAYQAARRLAEIP